nr:hypothetical protein [Rhodoferax sp.]
MTALFKNTFFFVSAYLVLMIPTYVLPYFGSNSFLVNGLGAGLGRGMTPMWWTHAWFLVMLIVIGSVRGKLIGKRYLMLFPALATVFDLVPGMNLVPLIPTLMHLTAIILGAMGKAAASDTSAVEAVPVQTTRSEAWGAGVMTLAAVLGSWQFTHNVKQTISTATTPSVEKTNQIKVNSGEGSPKNSSLPQTSFSVDKEQAPIKPLPKESKKLAVTSQPKPAIKTGAEQTKKPADTAPIVRLININD